MILRPWTDVDTIALAAWFVADPTLAARVGIAELVDLELHIAERQAQETRHEALVRAVAQDGSLAGYVTVFPRSGVMGVVHVILAPTARGSWPLLRSIADALAGLGLQHLIAPASPCLPPALQARWLRRIGFTVQLYGEKRYA